MTVEDCSILTVPLQKMHVDRLIGEIYSRESRFFIVVVSLHYSEFHREKKLDCFRKGAVAEI